MVSVQLKDIFMGGSSLRRIDQVIGLRSEDEVCLVQTEPHEIYFEVWSHSTSTVIMQKKVRLQQYELCSNLVALPSKQLTFYAVIPHSGIQALFIVDLFVKPPNATKRHHHTQSGNRGQAQEKEQSQLTKELQQQMEDSSLPASIKAMLFKEKALSAKRSLVSSYSSLSLHSEEGEDDQEEEEDDDEYENYFSIHDSPEKRRQQPQQLDLIFTSIGKQTPLQKNIEQKKDQQQQHPPPPLSFGSSGNGFEYSSKNSCLGASSFSSSQENVPNLAGSWSIEQGETDAEEVFCIYEQRQIDLFKSCEVFSAEILGQTLNLDSMLVVKTVYSFSNAATTTTTTTSSSSSSSTTTNCCSSNEHIYQIIVLTVFDPVKINEIIIIDESIEEAKIWKYESSSSVEFFKFDFIESLEFKYCVKGGAPSVYDLFFKNSQTGMYKILTHDFAASTSISRGLHNAEIRAGIIQPPFLIDVQEVYVKHQGGGTTSTFDVAGTTNGTIISCSFLLIVATVYKNHEHTTYWNVFKIQAKGDGLVEVEHVEASETNNADLLTHFIPDFTLVSPNIYFFSTSNIHRDVHSAVNAFIQNKDIHFKALQVKQQQQQQQQQRQPEIIHHVLSNDNDNHHHHHHSPALDNDSHQPAIDNEQRSLYNQHDSLQGAGGEEQGRYSSG